MDARDESFDIRARILEAATVRLAEHGYAGTSLRAVAEDVGIRAPSLLHHFSNKPALRDAVLETLHEHPHKDSSPRTRTFASASTAPTRTLTLPTMERYFHQWLPE